MHIHVTVLEQLGLAYAMEAWVCDRELTALQKYLSYTEPEVISSSLPSHPTVPLFQNLQKEDGHLLWSHLCQTPVNLVEVSGLRNSYRESRTTNQGVDCPDKSFSVIS